MKKVNILRYWILASISLLLITNINAQKLTPYPTVDKDCSNEISELIITSVCTGLGDEDFTLVTLQYATTLFKPWIRLDSKTTLTTNKSNTKYKILDWGIITDDEDDRLSSLNLDKQYSVKSRTSYELYMLFPTIPDNATLLSITESVKDGFFWTGIHINDKTTKDLSKDEDKPRYSQRGEFTPNGSGSGFAISSDGYIATCYHVIADAKAIRIKGINGNFETSVNAKVIVSDEKNDLAILKIDDTKFSQIPYSFATKLSDVGEDVFVLGYPQTQYLGEEVKLTTGVISARAGYRGDITTYQISAQALPGNSGCPLFDNSGNVIGIVSAKYIEPNVSYAVKLSYLKTLIENSEIKLVQPVSNTISSKTLAEKVKSIRNFVYIIEVQQ